MVQFHVTPHPSEAQVLQGQSQARVMYSVGVEGGTGGGEPDVPVFLGVVMDQSGSMEGEKLGSAKDALIKLLHQVPAGDNVVVHITLFSDQAEPLITPQTGRDIKRNLGNLTSLIRSINAGGATSLGS